MKDPPHPSLASLSIQLYKPFRYEATSRARDPTRASLVSDPHCTVPVVGQTLFEACRLAQSRLSLLRLEAVSGNNGLDVAFDGLHYCLPRNASARVARYSGHVPDAD